MARLIWLIAVVFLVSPLARAEPKAAAPKQMWLVLSPEEHFCAGPSSSSWKDPSDPLLFAAGVTARLDQHELWAAGGLPPLVAFRYEDGLLRLFLVGAATPTPIGITGTGIRARWPFC
jgi:hypothetical protein